MNKLLIALLLFGLIFTILSISYSAHSVTICDDTITCGVRDGICPEDIPGFGKCDVPDPDCGNVTPISGAPSHLVGPNYIYNCTKDGEIDVFTKVMDKSIYSIDGYCLDLRVQNSTVVDNPESAILQISFENVQPKSNLSIAGGYKINSTTEIENAIINVRVSKLWEMGIVKRTLKLYDMRGDSYNLTKFGSDNGYDYYKTSVNSFGTFYIGAKKRPTIWYVIHQIDLYYSNKINFVKVMTAILDYYGE